METRLKKEEKSIKYPFQQILKKYLLLKIGNRFIVRKNKKKEWKKIVKAKILSLNIIHVVFLFDII